MLKGVYRKWMSGEELISEAGEKRLRKIPTKLGFWFPRWNSKVLVPFSTMSASGGCSRPMSLDLACEISGRKLTRLPNGAAVCEELRALP